MSSIYTLKADIYSFLQTEKNWQSKCQAFFSPNLVGVKPQESSLRLSQMGDRCPRALWYSIHHPELDQPLPPWVQFKFAYGHLVEALVIAIAKACGHEVTGEQDEISYMGVKGHRDAVIDGYVVDVKSASGNGMEKFKGSLATSDTFGYLDQLDGYLSASSEDPLVRVKDKGFLFAVNRDLGHMEMYEHAHRPERITNRIRQYRSIVEKNMPPPCECGTYAHGASGNIALDVRASYSAQKYSCWPNLRCFLFAGGPVFFTHVAKVPTNRDGPITEVDRCGRIVYT